MDVSKARLFLIASLLSCSNAFCQKKKTFDPNQQITLSGPIRLDSLLKKISQQARFTYSYNARKVNRNLRLSFHAKNYSIEEILMKIKDKTGLDYSVADNHIILKPVSPISSPLVAPAMPASLKDKKQNESLKAFKSQPTIALDSSRIKSKPKDQDSIKQNITPGQINLKDEKRFEKIDPEITEAKDSVKKINLPIQTLMNVRSLKKSKQDETLKIDSSIRLSKTKPNQPVNQKKERMPLSIKLKAGISIDETTYLGPTVQLGVQSFYGTASYKTDFSLWLLSYGLGTSFKISKSLRVSLFVNTGNVSKAFNIISKAPGDTSTTIYDTVRVNSSIVAKSQLTRIGIMLEKKISPRMTLQAGIQYNTLSTNYIVNGASSSIGFAGSDADKKIHTLQPPYLQSNSYTPTSSSTIKSWMGIQVNLLYAIDFFTKQ